MGCTPSQKEVGSRSLCPQGHALKTKRRPDHVKKYCDKCKNNILSDYMGCDECIYNSCSSCVKGWHDIRKTAYLFN